MLVDAHPDCVVVVESVVDVEINSCVLVAELGVDVVVVGVQVYVCVQTALPGQPVPFN